jgi:3-dehydroquinate synthase
MSLTIATSQYPVHLFSQPEELARLIPAQDYSSLFILADENTEKHCLPLLMKNWTEPAPDLIRIPSGEIHKSLESCSSIWAQLLKAGADRHSLVLNLGGGVIGDMGGFCASTYMRGIDFIQIPTTLLAQVDASVGGKLGIDFAGVKNSIGLFRAPTSVLICPEFLHTLPEREWRSGLAEMIKHALIADPEHWDQLYKAKDWKQLNWRDCIEKSIRIKRDIVEKDPEESGLRKVLNFGHTLGHALESLSLQDNAPLLHGEAIAAGMIMEAFLSCRKTGLPQSKLQEISSLIFRIFGKYKAPAARLNELMELIRKDKKNKNGQIRFSLLEQIGQPVFDQSCTEEEIAEALAFYRKEG